MVEIFVLELFIWDELIQTQAALAMEEVTMSTKVSLLWPSTN